MRKYGSFLVGLSILFVVVSGIFGFVTLDQYKFYIGVKEYDDARIFLDTTEAFPDEFKEERKEASRICLEHWDYHIKAEYEGEPNWVTPIILCIGLGMTGFLLLFRGVFVLCLGAFQQQMLLEMKKLCKTIEEKQERETERNIDDYLPEL